MHLSLGSLSNKSSYFIEDFEIFASVLYELREADFPEIRRMEKMESPIPCEKRVEHRIYGGIVIQIVSVLQGGEPKADDQKYRGDSNPDHICVTGDVTPIRSGSYRCYSGRSKSGRSQRSG